MYTKKIMGEAVLDDTYEGTVGANPVAQWFWNLSVFTASGASDMNIAFSVEIDYMADFSNPIRLALS
jgi:hypothetical protein